MMISCFGPPPKPKSKHRKKPTKRPDPPAGKSPAASVMDLEPDVYAYMMRDGSWRPSRAREYWWSPSEIFAQTEWETHRKTLDSAYDQAKGTDEKITKLQASISNLQMMHAEHAKSSEQSFSKLQGSVGELKDAQSKQAKKQDECLAEVQKMYEHLAAEARKRDDHERERYFRERLEESYKLGRRHGKKKAASSRSSRLDEEGYASELRALRVELEAEKKDRHQRLQREAQRQAEEEAINRVLRRHRRLEEEERDRVERHWGSDEDRIRRLAERLWQERGTSIDVDDGGHDHEGSSSSTNTCGVERDRRPYWLTKLAPTSRGSHPVPPRPPPRPPPTSFHPTSTTASSMRYVDCLAQADSGTPWTEEEEELVEEFPICHPISRKERRRTTLRGPRRRVHYSWDTR